MPFSTPILEDFNGTDANPIGGNWTGLLNNLQRLSNQGKGTATQNVAYYNARQWSANCEAYVTIVTKPGTGGFIEVSLRLKDMSSTSTVDGYSARLTVVAGANNDTLTLRRIDNGTDTQLSTTTQEITDGDSIGFIAVGSRLELWHKTSSGAWTLKTTATDTTYTAGGYLGLTIISSTAVVDNYGGGDSYPPILTRRRVKAEKRR